MSRKKKSPSRRPYPVPQPAKEPSVPGEIDALTPAFLRWMGDEERELHEAVLDYAKTVLVIHQRLDPSSRSTSFSALTLEASICLAIAAYSDGHDFFYIPQVQALSLFTNFLEQTRLWTGTEGQLRELRLFYQRAYAAFDAFGPATGFDRPECEIPEPEDEERLQFLEQTPLASIAVSLLTNMDKQLRADPRAPWALAAAAAVESIAPSTPAGNDAKSLALTIFQAVGVSSVASSGSADRLAAVRQTLSDGDLDDRLEMLESLAYCAFEEVFTIGSIPSEAGLRGVGPAIGRILVQASDMTVTVSRLILTNPAVLVPAEQVHGAVKLYEQVAFQVRRLEALGLVCLGDEIVVPAPLRETVLRVWEHKVAASLAS